MVSCSRIDTCLNLSGMTFSPGVRPACCVGMLVGHQVEEGPAGIHFVSQIAMMDKTLWSILLVSTGIK